MIRRRRNPLRVLAIALGTVLVLAVAAIAAAVLLVDPNSLKPRIIAEVKRATGRDIAIAGPISIEATFPPTISAEDVSIANLPGFSRPQMATVRRVEAQIDPLALFSHRVVIERLVLMQPDMLFEVDARGAANWRLDRPVATTTAAAQTPAAGGTPPDAPRFSMQTIHVRNGAVTWRDARLGHPLRLDLPKLDATATATDAPASLVGEGTFDGAAFTLTAQTGPLTRLFERGAVAPAAAWPLQATLLGAAGADGVVIPGVTARFTVSGTVADPAAGRGYALTVDGNLPDLSLLAAPGARLPHLKGVVVSARIADSGAAWPDFSLVKLHAGPSDLSDVFPGLLLDQTDISIPSTTAPMHGEAHGTVSGTPLDVVATLGAPAGLLPGAAAPAGPLPLDTSINVAGLSLTAKGSVAAPTALAGLDVAVRAELPDLRSLAPLLGLRLPALRDIVFTGRVKDAASPGEPGRAIALSEARLTAGPGDVQGDATLRFGDRAKMQATLISTLLDLDAVLALASPTDAAAAAPTPAVPLPTAQPPAAPVRFIDRPLPLGWMSLGDADLSITLAELRSQGVAYHDIAGHAVLQAGHLTLDPFAGQTPSGRVEAALSIDSGPAEPPVALTLRAPALSAKPVLALLGLPDDVNGAVAVDADLKGSGRTPQALLAGVDGRLGLAMVDGDVDNRVIAAIVGEVLRAARLPADLGGAGRTRLRCLAVRLDATHGVATVGAFVLDAARLLLQGSGSIALADYGLNVRLRPVLRLGAGPGVAVPVRVGGTLREPKFSLDAAGALEATLSSALGAGAQAGRGVSPSGADRNGDLCPPALAAARNGLPGASPSAPPGGTTTAPARTSPADLLRSLAH